VENVDQENEKQLGQNKDKLLEGPSQSGQNAAAGGGGGGKAASATPNNLF